MDDRMKHIGVFIAIQIIMMRILCICVLFYDGGNGDVPSTSDSKSTDQEGDSKKASWKRKRGSIQKCDSKKLKRKRQRASELILQGLEDYAKACDNGFKHIIGNMELIGNWIGHARDVAESRRNVNGELMKLPLHQDQRLRAGWLIVPDDWKLYLFFSLPEGDKLEWVSMLLKGEILSVWFFLLDDFEGWLLTNPWTCYGLLVSVRENYVILYELVWQHPMRHI